MRIRVAALAALVVVLATLPLSGYARAPERLVNPSPDPDSGAALSGVRTDSSRGAPIRFRVGTFVPTAGEQLHLPAELEIEGYPEGQAGPYIVQFRGPIEGEWKAQVEGLGGVFLEYIPDLAFIVFLEPTALSAVRELPQVAWVGLYQPAYRLHPDLLSAEGVMDLVILTFPTELVETVATEVEALGGQIREVSDVGRFGGLLRCEVDASRLIELARIPAVHWIEPFYERELHNDVARGDSIMAAESIWSDLGLYGEGQVVAVSDTGLDTGDLDTLAQDFLGSPTGCSGTGRIVATFPLGDPDTWEDSCRCRDRGVWYSEGGHGTHVSGSVLGNGCESGSEGMPDYAGSHAGLAPQAGLVMQSVMGRRADQNCSQGGCGLYGLPLDLNTLFAQAQGAGAHIHTNSWGSAVNGQYTTDSRNTDVYMWSHRDYTILFSAGNSGTDANSDGVVDLDSMGAPGTAKNCITVGGSENYRLYGGVNPEHVGDPWDELQCTGNPGSCSPPPAPYWGNCWPDDYQASPVCPDRLSDNSGGMMAFSSRGPCDDGRIKPDVVAPGANILSTRSQGTYVAGGWGAGENQYYQFMGGTSMSTPLTAGGVALIREFFTDIQQITPSSALIKATLIHGATDLYPGQYGSGSDQEIPTPRPNHVEGWGRVDLADSLLPGGTRRNEYFDYYDDTVGRPGLRTGEHDTWTYEVTSGAVPFMSTLVWTDYPGSTAAAGALVNDLDLTVTDPGSTVHYPNGVGAADRTNNVEHVDIGGPSLGFYTVTVSGYNVAQEGTVPRQPYAVVDSGSMGEVVAAESMRTMPGGDQPLMVFGKTDVNIDFADSSGGDVTVVMNRAAPPYAPPLGVTFLEIDWAISTLMGSYSAQVVFHYDDADIPVGVEESTLLAYRYNGSAWDTGVGTVDTAANTVTIDGVTQFSNWALGGGGPTAVRLTSFSAHPASGGVLLAWETATEVDNLGFHLYRSGSIDALGERLNEALIPSEAPGQGQGASYSFLDETAPAGVSSYYTLEDVDASGVRTPHGPVMLRLWRAYLPLVLDQAEGAGGR